MRVASILVLLVCCAVESMASGLLRLDGTPTVYLTPRAVDISTTIKNQVAVTVTRQTFINATKSAHEVRYLFPTDVSATVSRFRWWANGAEREATIAGKPQDTSIFSGGSGAGAGGESRLTRYLGESPFIFPFKDSLAADSSLVVELTFVQLLDYRSGETSYRFPFRLSEFSASPLALTLDFSLHTDRTLATIGSASNSDVMFERSMHDATAKYRADAFVPINDLTVSYTVGQSDLDVTVMSVKPVGEEGYFVMLASPNPTPQSGQVFRKVFTFVIDVSGSMVGAKLEQAKEAARYTIDHVNPGDRFNIVRFSDAPTAFRPEPVAATDQNILDAKEFIAALRASGGTNMQDALLLALGQNIPENTFNVIVFLTDGLAPLDQQLVKSANTRNVRIYVFGVGTDVSKAVLTQLAVNNGGSADFPENNSVSNAIAAFHAKIRHPMLQNVAVKFTGGDVHETYPLRYPDLFIGEQLIVTGRYGIPGPSTVMVSGRAVGDSVARYDFDVELTGDSLVDLFIPKLWAKHKIDDLLVLMTGVPENSNQWKEWREEIIRLSLRYGILTRFSSFSDPGPNNGGTSTSVENRIDERESRTIAAGAIRMMIHPNPFRGVVTLSFELPAHRAGGRVVVRIYDMRGNLVRLLESMGGTDAGSVLWDGLDEQGMPVAAGAYMVRVDAAAATAVGMVTLLR